MSLMTAFPLLELAGFVSRININKISRRFFSYRSIIEDELVIEDVGGSALQDWLLLNRLTTG